MNLSSLYYFVEAPSEIIREFEQQIQKISFLCLYFEGYFLIIL